MHSHERHTFLSIEQLKQEIAEVEALILPLLETGLAIDEQLKLDDLQEQREDLLTQIHQHKSE